jgi:hypothetical protein
MREFLEGEHTLSELSPEEKLDALYEFLSSLPDRIERKKVYAIFPKMSKYQVDRAIRILDFSDILRTPYGFVEKTDKAKEIERRGLRVEDFSEAPTWIRRFIERKGIRREIYIGTDSITGYDIFYNYLRRDYTLRDLEGNLITRFKDLGLAVTFSIETEGHQILVCEICSWTFVKRMHPNNIDYVVDNLAKFAKDVIRVYFGIPIEQETIKAGLEYLSSETELTIRGTSFKIDKVMWEEAKCEIEYSHMRYAYTTEGERLLTKVENTPRRITVLRSKFYAEHPTLSPLVSPRQKQASLISFR